MELVYLNMEMKEELQRYRSVRSFENWGRCGLLEWNTSLLNVKEIERVYFKGDKTLPRDDIHKPWELDRQSARWFAKSMSTGRYSKWASKDRVKEIASRLKLTDRHIRRKLATLREAGRIPLTWLDGRQWHPPVEEAVRALGSLKEVQSRRHYTRKITSGLDYLQYLIERRTRRDELERQLSDLEETEATCYEWYYLTIAPAPFGHRSLSRLMRHCTDQRKKAYNFMKLLADKKGWDFCKLFVALCVALSNGSKTPVATANACVKLPHAKFYRRYGKMVKEAYQFAELWHNKPSSVGRAALLTHKPPTGRGTLDVAAAFEHWQQEVPESELYIPDDTQDTGERE